jgi:hypothetical protein
MANVPGPVGGNQPPLDSTAKNALKAAGKAVSGIFRKNRKRK